MKRPSSLCASLTAAIVVVALAPGLSLAMQGLPSKRALKPSPEALARLQRVDPLVDYFASLHYGPGRIQVDGNYVRALILTESSAKKGARSPKGAMGLTQIMPATGRWIAAQIVASGEDYDHVDEHRLRNFHENQLYDPAINLLFAFYLSADYHVRFGGRTDLVASAWNAGPDAVRRFGNRPPPFPETRGLLARLHGYLTYLQDGRRPGWKVGTWDSTGFDAPGWEFDPNEPGWDIGWTNRWKKPPRKF